MSVEIPITDSIFLSIATLATLLDPKILQSMHSKGNFSDKSTNFVAAACMIIFGLTIFTASLTELIFATSKGIIWQFVTLLALKFYLLSSSY